MEWNFWSNTALKWMWKLVNHLCIWPVRRILWRLSVLCKLSLLRVGNMRFQSLQTDDALRVGFDGRLQNLKKTCQSVIHGIFEQLSTGFWSNFVSMCFKVFGHVVCPLFFGTATPNLKRETTMGAPCFFRCLMGLWFQAIGILCDHGADTRHRTDMGASCVLLAACAPAPNALEEIFKRQGEAPDLKLDFQSDIGKGDGF